MSFCEVFHRLDGFGFNIGCGARVGVAGAGAGAGEGAPRSLLEEYRVTGVFLIILYMSKVKDDCLCVLLVCSVPSGCSYHMKQHVSFVLWIDCNCFVLSLYIYFLPRLC